MLKCQEGMKDNPRSETQMFCQDNGIRRNVSKPGEQWQNGQAERCSNDIRLSRCLAKAGAQFRINFLQGQEQNRSPLIICISTGRIVRPGEPATLDSKSIQVHTAPNLSLRETDMAEVIHTYTYIGKAEQA